MQMETCSIETLGGASPYRSSIPACGIGNKPPPHALAGPLPQGRVWTVDFTRKRLSDGKHFVVCNVVDISAGDWIVGAVRSHFSSTAVIAMLEDAGEYRGLPELIVLANFVSLGTQDLTRWGQSRGVAVHENVMPPVLNTERMARRPIHERFTTISQVQRLVDKWRRASGRNEGHTVH